MRDYYIHSGVLGDEDYICGMNDDSGMSKCHVASDPERHLPMYRYNHSIFCNGSALPGSDNDASWDGSCVNWNQYYTECRALAPNPFLGSISFDNIGLAWVVIFQVRDYIRRALTVATFRSAPLLLK